ncbi:MAG: tetratricopeptide repeat protein [Vicinamibacteria bacterium]|nr:tetratricopeptide repeat protein [Vicinamibacteria bacterium]
MTRTRISIRRGSAASAAVALLVLPASSVLSPVVRAQGLSVPLPTARPQQKLSASEALRRGEYARAIEAARADLVATPGSGPALSRLVAALLETGAHASAEETTRAFLARNANAGEAWNTLGDVLVARGRRGEAEAAYARAIASRGAASLAAEASLGLLLNDRGLRAEATARFERLIAAYNAGRATSAQNLIAVGKACRALGASNPDAFKDALKAFDEAAALDETHEARLRTGELFLEKFNGTEARTAFETVLRTNPRQPRALLGLARARDFDGERGVPDLVDAALATDPGYAEAYAYRSGLLLALEDFPAALAQAEKALAVNPSSAEALAAKAAAQYVSGDSQGFAATRQRAESLFPASGDLLVTVAEAAVRNRLYRESAQLAREALARDPRSWAALASLGQNQLRLGEIDDARKSLERSFEGDPYNVWVKNTLDLMDTFRNYTLVDAGRFRLFLDKKEAGILGPPMGALAAEAIQKLSERYGFSPAGPIRVEAYPSHADFSVRTVGLAGLGALGVCFGPVVAIDSPQARERGAFNWGSTLWHELAHVVTMGASGNRVPRWLTEGISVHEERRARPGWGDDLSLEFLLAYQAGRLLSLRDLNNGFVRPRSPDQVSLSYYQASLVVEYMEGRYGLAALRGLLGAYAGGATTEKAFESAIGRTLEQVDAEFQAWLKARLAGPLAGIRPSGAPGSTKGPELDTRAALEARLAKDDGDFVAHAMLGLLNHREKREDDALKHLERAARIWPGSSGDESPYFAIAEIKLARGDRDGAMAALKALVALNENHDAARRQLASLLESAGELQAAFDVLESLVFIYPFDPALHERRAALASRLRKPREVVEARRAIVALDPVDKAEAYYQLALAEIDAGDRAAARRSVLRSLEVAPRFERAQELLLRIHREEKIP